MPCLKRMTNPKFCYHSCCLKTSCNMQHDVDNLLVSVLETMTFYKGANLIFSSQFSDMCSVLHLTVLTAVSAMMFWNFVPFSLSKLHQLEGFSMTFPLVLVDWVDTGCLIKNASTHNFFIYYPISLNKKTEDMVFHALRSSYTGCPKIRGTT
jgi:hypothetical protein